MKVTEYCPHCEHEVKIQDLMFAPQPCPKCGHAIKACSLCDTDICDCSKCEKKFPPKIYKVYSHCDGNETYWGWFPTLEEAIADAEQRHERDENLHERYTCYVVYSENEIEHITEGRYNER